MPHGKRSKKRSKRKCTQRSEKQLQETEKRPKLQETEKQSIHQVTENQHDDPQSHNVYNNSKVTDVSGVTVASFPLDRPQAYLPHNSLPKMHFKYLETQGVNWLDETSREEQNRKTKQSPDKDAQQINEKAATQVDDKSLLNIIESADPHQAVQLLEGNNHFSQDALDRALISACRHGLKYLVQTLVRLGANVQFKDTQENNPLLICAENGFIDIVHFLLKKKANVNAFNSARDTALILSIRAAGSLEMVRVLLEHDGIDTSHQNQDGYTALMKAVEVGDVDVIKILMDRCFKEDWGEISRQAGKPSCLRSIDAVNLKGMTAEQIADKCGLGDIYHILETHLRDRVSPLVLAVEGRDIKSLQLLLDCYFIKKKDIQMSFMKIFEKCDLKEVKLFTEEAVLIIKRLLECGAQVNATCYRGSSPLSVAVEMGDYDLVELLCHHLGQRQNLRSECGLEALVAAARSGRCDLIKLLLKYKTDINNNDRYSDSPLDCALSHGHLESAKLLIQHGAKMDIGSALQSAVTKQLPEYIEFVFENYRPEVKNFATKYANELDKLLMPAAHRGNLEIIEHLLDAGADVNQEIIFEDTPLGISKNGEVAKYLISKGANVNIALSNGDIMLLRILDNINPNDSTSIEVLKVLLENGALVNERGNRGRTPLMAAVSGKKNVGAIQLLLDHGADISIQDEEGNTALIRAACRGCPLNLSCLLQFHKEKNISINAQNDEGKTALMFAVTESDPEIVGKLINFDADINVKDVDGNTALLHAANYNIGRVVTRIEVLTILVKAGADVNCQNNDGFFPLMLAAKLCWKDAISILLDSGADVNAVSEKDKTKTALSFLPTRLGYCKYFKGCFQAFIKNGASLSYLDPGVIHKMIFNCNIDCIPELIQAGLEPANIEIKNLNLDYVDCKIISAASPLCVALLVGNVSLARYFVGNMFLTSSDVTCLRVNTILRGALQKRQRHDCLTFLDELSSQPWSLFQLAFVSVLSAIGSSPGREDRVNLLPLSQIMKDKLLFKSQDVQLNTFIHDIDFLEQRFSIIF